MLSFQLKNGRNEYWLCKPGSLHRRERKARKEYWKCDGSMWYSYNINGSRHHIKGPAFRSFLGSGRVSRESFFIDGLHLSEFEWRILTSSNKSG